MTATEIVAGVAVPSTPPAATLGSRTGARMWANWPDAIATAYGRRREPASPADSSTARPRRWRRHGCSGASAAAVHQRQRLGVTSRGPRRPRGRGEPAEVASRHPLDLGQRHRVGRPPGDLPDLAPEPAVPGGVIGADDHVGDSPLVGQTVPDPAPLVQTPVFMFRKANSGATCRCLWRSPRDGCWRCPASTRSPTRNRTASRSSSRRRSTTGS